VSVEEDVATVLALEEPAKALLKAIEAAQPAIGRLCEAKYAGIEDIETQLATINTGNDDALGALLQVLSVFRTARGNSGAFDYLYYVEQQGETVGETAKMILDMDDDDEHLQRVEALRQYAATAAR
jgi:hypothetical protein